MNVFFEHNYTITGNVPFGRFHLYLTIELTTNKQTNKHSTRPIPSKPTLSNTLVHSTSELERMRVHGNWVVHENFGKFMSCFLNKKQYSFLIFRKWILNMMKHIDQLMQYYNTYLHTVHHNYTASQYTRIFPRDD